MLCGDLTRVGALMVHAASQKEQEDARNESAEEHRARGRKVPVNHFLCEKCSNMCLFTLLPQTFCYVCLRVPQVRSDCLGYKATIVVQAIYVTPPLEDKQTDTILCEGYRR